MKILLKTFLQFFPSKKNLLKLIKKVLENLGHTEPLYPSYKNKK
jgi:hypothetical protein